MDYNAFFIVWPEMVYTICRQDLLTILCSTCLTHTHLIQTRRKEQGNHSFGRDPLYSVFDQRTDGRTVLVFKLPQITPAGWPVSNQTKSLCLLWVSDKGQESLFGKRRVAFHTAAACSQGSTAWVGGWGDKRLSRFGKGCGDWGKGEQLKLEPPLRSQNEGSL